jgi:quercetin dioxygenase-like cupin family protein
MIHADEKRETHFGIQELAEREVVLGPPPNPAGQMGDFGAVTSMCSFFVPAGTSAPAHNAPQPYVVIVLSGEAEVVTSDGEARRFRPGDLLFCNDLTGKGHETRAITDLLLAFVNRTNSAPSAAEPGDRPADCGERPL